MHRAGRSYEELSRYCGGTPTSKRLQQLARQPIKNFPDPETVRNLAMGLRVSQTAVVLAAAESLGLDVGTPMPRLVQLLPSDTDQLSEEQAAAIAQLVSSAPEHARGLLMFLVGTGCRWGEAVALEVGDWQRPNVRIRRALKWSPDNQRAVGPTKTKRSNRTVLVGEALARVLDEGCAGKARDQLVFTAPRGGAVLHRTFWSRVWLPAVEGLEPRPRIHDLRHTAASWLLGAGVPPHVVQRRLGHESIQTTVDTYGHLMPDAQAAAANAAELALGFTSAHELDLRRP